MTDILIEVAKVIDSAAFELWREDRVKMGSWTRDASKRRRIATAKAQKIITLIERTTP